MKKGRPWRALCLVLLLLCLLPQTALADWGPKPSVSLHVKGIEGEFYFTLLSTEKQYGPWNADSPSYSSGIPAEIDAKFRSYPLPDGFYYQGGVFFSRDKAGYSKYYVSWSYYAPETFRILFYLPDTDTFILSDETYERHTLQAVYEVTVQDGRITSVQSTLDLLAEVGGLALRTAITILVELLIAYFMKIRDSRDRTIIVLTNLVTQLLLNGGIWYWGTQHGAYGMAALVRPIELLPLEALVLAVEILVYRRALRKAEHPVRYAVIANLTTYVLGMIL